MLSFDPSEIYSQYTLDLDAQIAWAGIDLTTDGEVYVRFQYISNNITGNRNVYFDDVRIETGPIVSGPRATAQDPVEVTANGGPLNNVRFTFDQAVDPASFTPSDVILIDPQGFEITPVTVAPVAGSGDTQFDLGFADYDIRGRYRLTVGPDVLDTGGRPMNQDGDGFNGEPADAYVSTVWFSPSALSVPNPPETELYLEGFEGWPPIPSNWAFETERGGTIQVVSGSAHSGDKHLYFLPPEYVRYTTQSAMFLVDLSAHAAAPNLFLEFYKEIVNSGYYTLYPELSNDGVNWVTMPYISSGSGYTRYVIPIGQQVAASPELTLNDPLYVKLRFYRSSSTSTASMRLDDVRISTADLAGPKVLSHRPTDPASTGGPLNTIRIEFDEAIDPATFTPDDVTLTGPFDSEALIDIDDVSPVDGSGNTQFDITFSDQQVRGTYNIVLTSAINDLAGNVMNQDGDYVAGEWSEDRYTGVIEFTPTIAVAGAGPELYRESFEWPPVSTQWRFQSDYQSHFEVDENPEPAMGKSPLLFSTYRERTQTATLSLDLSSAAGSTDLFLEFWAAAESTYPSELHVDLSGDGSVWQNSVYTTVPTTDYALYALDFDEAVASAGVALDGDVYVRFRHYNTPYMPLYSIVWLDDVRLVSGPPSLQLVLSAESVSENAGGGAMTARVARSATLDLSSPLTVTLTGDDPSEAVWNDSTVLIPAGRTNSDPFLIDVVDDLLLDGTQIVTFAASAVGFVTATARLEVTDYETLALDIADAGITETDYPNSTTVTVTRSNIDDLTLPLDLTLSSSDPTEATVPSPVTIPAGEASYAFPITAVADGVVDGPQEITIAAQAPGYVTASDSLWVEDSDGAHLALDIPVDTAQEQVGGFLTAATITRAGDTTSALEVNLVSSQPNEIYVPPTVTIPAGAAFVDFDVHVVNDPEIDGTQTAEVTAYAAGHVLVQSRDQIDVTDDDVPGVLTVGGRLSGTLSTGTFHVLTDIHVMPEVTLSMQPATTLLFDPGIQVLAEGELLAEGEPGNLVKFTSGAATPARGDWLGIQVVNSGGPRTILDNVEIEFADVGLKVSGVDRPWVTLSHANVHDNLSIGVSLEAVYGDDITSSDVHILDSRIYDNGGAGVYVRARGTASWSSGSLSSGNSPTISRNEISHNDGSGILIRSTYTGGSGYVGSAWVSPTVTGNWIHHNQDAGIVGHAFEPYDAFGTGAVAGTYTNNLVVNNASDGIRLTRSYGQLEPKLVNNTVADNLGAGIKHDTLYDYIRNNIVTGNATGIEATSPEPFVPAAGQATYNDVWNNSGGDWVNYDWGTGAPASHNNMSENPQFTTQFTGAQYYHIRGTSPCVDAGTDSGAPTEDHDFQTRRSPADIGFDEAIVLEGRYVFYNNSYFDTPTADNPVFNDDTAIASDKTALLPGETATFANYTGYNLGINGIIIDVPDLPGTPTTLDPSNFVFKVGNDNTPDNWDTAPAPTSITVREDEGGGGSDRVTIIWPDGAIKQEWLQVTMPMNKAATRLAESDVFYFGNSVGENTGDFRVDYSDAFDNIWPLLFTSDPIGVDHPGDVNRDRRIDYSDIFDAVWPNLFGPSPLVQLTAPATPAAPLESTGFVFDENLPWAIELMWLDELYGTSSNSEEEEDDAPEPTAVDGAFAMYSEE